MAAVACLLSASALTGGTLASPTPSSAANAPLVCKPLGCPPTPVPSASPSSTCFFGPDFCPPSPSPSPSPSPVLVVVSPVPPDPSPSHTIPSYLQGLNPSPTPTQQTTDSISSAVPLAGGFVDQLPTPSAAAETASPNDLAPHSSGVPLPFLAAGALLILAAVGSLLYAITPRNKPIFDATPRPAAASPVRFTPYGPEGPAANILSGPKTPRSGPRGPK